MPCFSTCCKIVGGATLQSASVAPGLDSQRAYQPGALAAAATEARPVMQAKRGAAGPAGAAMGMPPLPAAEQQKTSPGAAARAVPPTPPHDGSLLAVGTGSRMIASSGASASRR